MSVILVEERIVKMEKLKMDDLKDYQKSVLKYCNGMAIIARLEHENYGRSYEEINEGFGETMKRVLDFIQNLAPEDFGNVAQLENIQQHILKDFNEQLRDALFNEKNEPPTDKIS